MLRVEASNLKTSVDLPRPRRLLPRPPAVPDFSPPPAHDVLLPPPDDAPARADTAGPERWVVRLELNRNGRAVRRLTAFDTRVDAGDTPTAFAVSGDELSLVTGGLAPPQASGDAVSSLGPPAELVVRRLRLR